ncbi:MAG: hypothetical protein IAE87_07305 [Rhodobacteraceae bacterium]|nr:hypothetical protein [Paracoccaceae bacterium]
MTNPMMDLPGGGRERSGIGPLREMIGLAAERRMELGVGAAQRLSRRRIGEPSCDCGNARSGRRRRLIRVVRKETAPDVGRNRIGGQRRAAGRAVARRPPVRAMPEFWRAGLHRLTRGLWRRCRRRNAVSRGR